MDLNLGSQVCRQQCDLVGCEKRLCGFQAMARSVVLLDRLAGDPEERVAGEYTVPSDKLCYLPNRSEYRCSWLPSSKSWPIP